MEGSHSPVPEIALASSSARVELFGGLRLLVRGRVVTRFSTRKTAALLAFLAYYRHREHLREALVDLFWPDSDPRAGRRSLSVALSELRRELEPPGSVPGSVLRSDRLSVRLELAAVGTDTGEFEEAVAAAGHARSDDERRQGLRRAVDRYGGALLPGYADEWTAREQRRLDGMMARSLGELMRLQEQAGDLEGALASARRAVRLQPLHEAAHRELMRLMALAGQVTEALHHYQMLERMLRREVDALPSLETRALARELAKQANAPAAP